MQLFRDLVHGFFGKAVLGVVIALFVLYGTEALVSLTARPSPVATVNHAELYTEQLTNMVEQQKQTILRQNPGLPLDFIKDEYLRSQVAQRWVERQLINQAISEWGIRPDKQSVVAQLKADSRFATDGEIQQDILASWLKANGLSSQVLFDDIRSNLGLDKLLTGLEASEFIVPKEIEQVRTLQDQTRAFSIARISPEAVQSEIKLSDAELKDYYQVNINNYMEPESAQVQYLVFDLESLTTEVKTDPSDAELFGFYEMYKQSLKLEEKRESSHILIDTSDRSEDEALELANSLSEKIKAGDDFAALAAEYSDDVPSAEEGGRLPMSERGTFVEPFEEALYALNEGEVSEPVKTDFGFHIIRLEKIVQVEPVAFEEKRVELEKQFAEGQKKEFFRTLLDDVALLAFESSNLDELAAANGLEVKSSTSFSRTSAPAPLNNPKVLDAIFADDFFSSGRNSDLIELDDRAIVLHPMAFKEAAPKAFAQVKDEVKKVAEKEASKVLAEEKGRDIIAKLKVSNELNDKEKELLGAWTDYSDVDRRSAQVSASIVQKLFAMPKPAEDKVVLTSLNEQDDFVVIRLKSISQKPQSDDDAELDTLAAQLKQSASRSLASLLVDALKDSADIEYGTSFVVGKGI